MNGFVDVEGVVGTGPVEPARGPVGIALGPAAVGGAGDGMGA